MEERARRRSQQLGGSDTKKIMDEIRNRDLQDTLRETAPLTQASDAIVIDTSQKDFETCVLEAINTITDHKNP